MVCLQCLSEFLPEWNKEWVRYSDRRVQDIPPPYIPLGTFRLAYHCLLYTSPSPRDS